MEYHSINIVDLYKSICLHQQISCYNTNKDGDACYRQVRLLVFL